MGIKLLIGLGNPGRKYRKTRHNIGFVVLERLAALHEFDIEKKKFNGVYALTELFDKKICCIEPLSFMNLCGEVVDPFWNYFKVTAEDVLVIHDDIDLPLGKLRFSVGAGHGGHNGIRSIIDRMDTKDFYRLRFGVGRPPEDMDPADHVLTKFGKEEAKIVDTQVDKAVKAIECFYKDGPKRAMELYNS